MKGQRGFSLIEVIVTVAIVSILGIALLEIFGTSFSNVARAGHRTENLYSLQEVMDDAIAGNPIDPNSAIKVEEKPGHQVFVNETEVKGRLITVTHDQTNEKLTTFIANPSEDNLEDDSENGDGEGNE